MTEDIRVFNNSTLSIDEKYDNLKPQDFTDIANAVYQSFKAKKFKKNVMVKLSNPSEMKYDVENIPSKYKIVDFGEDFFKVYIIK